MAADQVPDGHGGLTAHRLRYRVRVGGVVQGVGFRPFVYALAHGLGLAGWVGNTGDGVSVEVEGAPDALEEFVRRIAVDAPPLADVAEVSAERIAPVAGTGFTIVTSQGGGGRTMVPPDIATCADCLAELHDPTDRRSRHPFISCTNCGPRFTIIRSLPYDRPATTMAELPLCATCAAEYADPADRRFHAQTVACPRCGPTLALSRAEAPDETGAAALAGARRLLAEGAVVAVKGLGGYHLACDARDETVVAALRKRKDRGDKPFAVMAASLAVAEAIAVVSPAERRLLCAVQRPVVLLRARGDASGAPAPSVAPGHPDIGVMLPYTPLHHLLFGLPGDPAGPSLLVMTSGNLAGEPIVTDDAAARTRLASLADAWLWSDRPIRVPCDDSVVRVADGDVLPVRRSRGYAPLPIALPMLVRPALAVGGDLKNTCCVAEDGYAWLSAHVGDMDDLATRRAFETAADHLGALCGVRPELVVADEHPGYRSTAWARRNPAGLPVATVQHHHAHIASAMAEHGHTGATRVIGFAFDGTGYGRDGAVWGGEALLADYAGFERAAQLRYVPLPGGDAGVRNPCRMALSHLRAAGVPWDARLPCVAACSDAERAVLARQLDTGLRCTPTSSMGRLFDALSSLAGVCHRVRYEAEAAMRFEELARDAIDGCSGRYAFALVRGDGGRSGRGLPAAGGRERQAAWSSGLREADGEPARAGRCAALLADPAPVIAAAASDVLHGAAPRDVAARFHLAVVDLVVTLAVRLRERTGLSEVALSGGVFLNVLLTTLCTDRLRDHGFRVLRHRRVPPSDAGLALGQVAVGARQVGP
ncbi:carbamoyltransferase HypF [Streptomyces odontomachi]|uniref:carbamoyltransferase HypF n=1 Tax=Streptomyces odontomachi TaxID=2944940 RepID=UPI00210BB47D|nr:carbamoyltransferase HypF [Streptomyces sp. ODS25]